MNQRNVEALSLAIEQAAVLAGKGSPAPSEASNRLARWLAMTGVLDPKAITFEQMKALGAYIEQETAGDSYDDEAHLACVGYLERIAKGEGQPVR